MDTIISLLLTTECIYHKLTHVYANL